MTRHRREQAFQLPCKSEGEEFSISQAAIYMKQLSLSFHPPLGKTLASPFRRPHLCFGEQPTR
jgi:hypothetical protein